MRSSKPITVKLLIAVLAFLCLSPRVGRTQVVTNLGGIKFPTADAFPGDAPLPLPPNSIQAQSKLDALPLHNTVPLSEGLNSHGFLSSVGGVAFGGVAVGDRGWEIEELKYVSTADDGRRLVVDISSGGRNVSVMPELFDWELAPIARFAAGEQHACFTLFGRLRDEAEHRKVKEAGNHVLGYHPAFRNTLLGLRLLQADLLIIRDDACELPAVEGKLLLAPNERTVYSPPERCRKAYELLSRDITNSGAMFQSFVVCDQGQQVKFGLYKGQLVLSGLPQWYCWRSKIEDRSEIERLTDLANQRANEVLRKEIEADQRNDAAGAARKWTQSAQQVRHTEVFDKIVSANMLQPLPHLSKLISEKVNTYNGVNPVIYRSLVTAMRYSALFRYYKEKDPAAYASFVESLKDVKPEPAVFTPTIMIDPR